MSDAKWQALNPINFVLGVCELPINNDDDNNAGFV